MTRLSCLAATVFYTIFLGISLHSQTAHASDLRRPNIIFIFIDDMGYADPSCFGNPLMKTPCIDRLADEGLKLTNFYVNSPICSPSRVAVTTGQYPARWKIHSYLASRASNASRGMADFLDPRAPSIGRILKEAGYATAHFGKWHMGGGRDVDDAPQPSAYGFDEHLVCFEGMGPRIDRKTPKHRWTETYVDRGIDFMRRNKDQAFFLRIFPNDVHDAHIPAPGTTDRWVDKTDDKAWQKFFAVLEEMDRQIGRLVDEVDRLGIARETLIVFTSDNGPTDWPHYYKNPEQLHPPGFTGPYFGRKWSLYEGGIRMPFIARWTGQIDEGVTDSTSLMCGIDLPPTFCRIAGITPADVKFDGLDRSSVLLDKPSSRTDPIFWQYGAPHAKLKGGLQKYHSPTFAVRDGDWKLLINADGTCAQLFNLANDPSEKRNLLTEEMSRAETLWAAIREWADRVGLETEGGRPQLPPPPPVPISLPVSNKSLEAVNVGVTVDSNGHWTFDGKSHIELPRHFAAEIIGGEITVAATIESRQCSNSVILAHGGDRAGYSLYLEDDRPTFSICVDWKRTTIRTAEKLPHGRHTLEAKMSQDGRLTLTVDGLQVAEGKAPKPLKEAPGDTLQIGADLIMPVGEYEVPNTFKGTLSDVRIN